MPHLSNRLRIVLAATVFNLLFEYSLRGTEGFLRPMMPLVLFGFYFTLYSMAEDLIVRFKLKNYQLVLVCFLYGLFPMAFVTGTLFRNPHFLGVNWVSMFYVGFLWWGILQGLLTFYLANRLFTRDWAHRRLGVVGWTACILYNLVIFGAIHAIRLKTVQIPPVAHLVVGFIILSVFLFLVADIRRNSGKQWEFEKSKIMDLLTFGTAALFIFSGTFIATKVQLDVQSSSYISLAALRIINIWTVIFSVIYLVYRFIIRKKPLSI